MQFNTFRHTILVFCIVLVLYWYKHLIVFVPWVNLVTSYFRLAWVAPECYGELGKDTCSSDLFAYGTTLWEIFSQGHDPFPKDFNAQQVCKIKERSQIEFGTFRIFAIQFGIDIALTIWYILNISTILQAVQIPDEISSIMYSFFLIK